MNRAKVATSRFENVFVTESKSVMQALTVNKQNHVYALVLSETYFSTFVKLNDMILYIYNTQLTGRQTEMYECSAVKARHL